MRTRLLRLLPPEPAHTLSIRALQLGLGGRAAAPDPRLRVRLWGQDFASPLGLAAGFDKQGQVMTPLLNLGLGFVEVGTITPHPQPGNPRPRVFRAPAHQAVINRYGFNSHGHGAVLARLAAWRQANPDAPLGINLGMNKGEDKPIAAYVQGIRTFEQLATYLVINLSSPNTAGLRDQQTQGLADLIKALKDAQSLPVPLLLKIAPDLQEEDLAAMAEVMLAEQLDGLIVSNTTLARPASLPAKFAAQTGGLSGAPLTDKALATLKTMARLLDRRIPLIGVGGIMSGADAVARLRAGADLLQTYTGLMYSGPALIAEIHEAILAAMDAAGVQSPQDLKDVP